MDIITTPGETVRSPVSGYVKRADVDPYGDKKYGGVEIESDDGYVVKMLYVDPNAAKLTQGQRVEAGKTPIGMAQDLSVRYPHTGSRRMTNHVHIEIRKNGVVKDPTPAFRGP